RRVLFRSAQFELSRQYRLLCVCARRRIRIADLSVELKRGSEDLRVECIARVTSVRSRVVLVEEEAALLHQLQDDSERVSCLEVVERILVHLVFLSGVPLGCGRTMALLTQCRQNSPIKSTA